MKRKNYFLILIVLKKTYINCQLMREHLNLPNHRIKNQASFFKINEKINEKFTNLLTKKKLNLTKLHELFYRTDLRIGSDFPQIV